MWVANYSDGKLNKTYHWPPGAAQLLLAAVNPNEIMKRTTTHRGFAYNEFEDVSGTKCSLQKSSSVCEDRIWLGANEIGLQEFVAYRDPAWQRVELENTQRHHYIANNRMHLNRRQSKTLGLKLIWFWITGRA